jgi:hypothetical protein
VSGKTASGGLDGLTEFSNGDIAIIRIISQPWYCQCVLKDDATMLVCMRSARHHPLFQKTVECLSAGDPDPPKMAHKDCPRLPTYIGGLHAELTVWEFVQAMRALVCML